MVVGGQTHSTLIFTPTKDDNGKALVCRGWNEKLPNKVKEDARILDIRCKIHLILISIEIQ